MENKVFSLPDEDQPLRYGAIEDFRLAIKVGKRAAGRGQDTRAAAAEQHASYFDFSYLRHLLPAAGPEHPLPGSPARFLGFTPDFAYRYVKVPAITASQAQALGEHYGLFEVNRDAAFAR